MSVINTKPECNLIGQNGNVFNLIGIVVKTLNRAKLRKEAQEFQQKAIKSESYDDVLQLMHEYVEII